MSHSGRGGPTIQGGALLRPTGWGRGAGFERVCKQGNAPTLEDLGSDPLGPFHWCLPCGLLFEAVLEFGVQGFDPDWLGPSLKPVSA